MARKRKVRPLIGWRELIELPELSPVPIKVKIDTGARTSALHAFDLEVEEIDGVAFATFDLHPRQRSSANAVAVRWPVQGYRRVRSSNGETELRPVIVTLARLGGIEWPIEVTLTTRDQMGFRMLLGRAAMRKHFLIHPGRSFVASPRPSNRKDPES